MPTAPCRGRKPSLQLPRSEEPALDDVSDAPLLVIKGLCKAYGEVVAVAGIDLDVRRGEVVGLLGVNGAGKTTTVECIAGLTRADAGIMRIAGIDANADPMRARQCCNLATQATGLPPKLSVGETLRLFAALHHVADVSASLMARFGLEPVATTHCAALSGGTRQRLALALALVGDPALVILDEPTAGLDPAARQAFHDLIGTLRADGRGVLIATHDMAEAEALCDRVAIVAVGRIVATGPPAALVAGRATGVRVRTDRAIPTPTLAAIAGAAAVVQDGCEASFAVADPRELLARLAAALLAADIALVAIETRDTSLADLIVALEANRG